MLSFQTNATTLFCICGQRTTCARTLRTSKPTMSTVLMSKISTPALIFITPDSICTQPKRAKNLCDAVVKTSSSTLVQIRDTTADEKEICNLVLHLLSRGVPPERLIVNGGTSSIITSLHPHLGIHVRERDVHHYLPELFSDDDNNNRVIGCAVHSLDTVTEVLRITQRAPDYLQVGTMFTTKTHPGKIPEGLTFLDRVSAVCNQFEKKLLLIGVGGINLGNAASVIAHGAHGVAVIRSISDAEDAVAATCELMKVLNEAQGGHDTRLHINDK